MLQQGSYLKIVDNSSVKEVSCIRVYNNGGKRFSGNQGDEILASVKSLRRVKQSILRSRKHLLSKSKGKSWEKGDLVKILVVRSRQSIDRAKGLGKASKNHTGIKVRFPLENSGVVLGRGSRDPLATRIKGPLSPTMRNLGFGKVISLGGTLL